MQVEKRLWEAYKGAKFTDIDEHSKYIFFSDCHRGDDSASDEFTRNQSVLLHALNHYYNNGYTYVEVGDGDDLWEYKNFKNIRLAHSDIFAAIRQLYLDNRFVLLYGNHNNFLRSPAYVKENYYTYYDEFTQENRDLLSGITVHEALVLRYTPTGQEILILHGNQGDTMNDQLWMVSLAMLRSLWRYLHVVGFQNPTSPAKNLYTSTKIELRYKGWIERSKKFIICGHTHRPKFAKSNEIPYFNTGCCTHTKGITGIEIADGSISLVSWRIEAEPDGNMRIDKSVMRGPVPIKEFDFKQAHAL